MVKSPAAVFWTSVVSHLVWGVKPIQSQWRTEETVRGVRALTLAYDLRNKSARMRQNMVFSTKNTKYFLERGHNPLPKPFFQW